MIKNVICLLIICQTIFSQAQVVCSQPNKDRLIQILDQLNDSSLANMETGNLAVEIGKLFLGVPYVAKTLDGGKKEQLVVNIKELDCTTYLENVVVLTRLTRTGRLDYEEYLKELEFVRYRKGLLDGYNSRLHYFSDWIFENAQKEIIQDVTENVGGMPYSIQLDFMSKHPQYYPQLSNDDLVDQVRKREETINKRPYYYIPKSELKQHQEKIRNGDLIAITTSIAGLDIVHVGFAIWKDQDLHLLHATTDDDQVEISTLPLVSRLNKFKNQTGIIVARMK
ncbi:MAG: DUF1460 domain-containing protein [Flavobacteriales bacterium]|nr:DUF1460 domain-containing protein [Flavobacteriales bacterium]